MELIKNPEFTWDGETVQCDSGLTWGIAEQANGLFGILLNVPGGVLTGVQVEAIARIIGRDGVLKNTRRMAPIILLTKERVGDALKQLAEVGLKVANIHRSFRNVVACPGKGFSANARGDTLELAAALDREFYGTVLPWDFKVGISGCPRNCSGVQCHDVGLMAEPRGKYSLWIGGTESGMNPKHGTLVQKGIHRDKIPAVVRAIMEEYIKAAEEYAEELDQRVRLYKVIEKAGIERFVQAVSRVLA